MKPNRRRQRIIARGPAAMLVVAGLPLSLHNRAASALKELSPIKTKIVVLPSAQRDGLLYPEEFLASLVRGVGGFAVRRRTHGSCDFPAPSSITLLYVPASDDECLLRRLDFAVFPVPLRELAARDARGQQLRHSFDAITAAFRKVLGPGGPIKTNLDVIRERINRLADSEALLLPPRNFFVDDKLRVESLFRDLISGSRLWTDKLAELPLCLVTRDTVRRLPPGQTRKAFKDCRNLVFLTAHPSAYDGKARAVEGEASDGELLIRVKGLYRFGAALPNGFHHDVQFEYGRDLGGVECECAQMGTVRVHGSHVNIFINDFVRGANGKK